MYTVPPRMRTVIDIFEKHYSMPIPHVAAAPFSSMVLARTSPREVAAVSRTCAIIFSSTWCVHVSARLLQRVEGCGCRCRRHPFDEHFITRELFVSSTSLHDDDWCQHTSRYVWLLWPGCSSKCFEFNHFVGIDMMCFCSFGGFFFVRNETSSEDEDGGISERGWI